MTADSSPLDNLVQRLRNWATDHRLNEDERVLLREAADAIERLREHKALLKEDHDGQLARAERLVAERDEERDLHAHAEAANEKLLERLFAAEKVVEAAQDMATEGLDHPLDQPLLDALAEYDKTADLNSSQQRSDDALSRKQEETK
jgi:hypothetical protein